MRILWITPKWTLPVTDGARVATDCLVRNLTASGVQIDYWSLSNQDDIPDETQMKRIWGVQSASSDMRSLPSSSLKKKLYYLYKLVTSPLSPLTFSSFRESRFIESFNRKVETNNYDYIVLDGLHLGVLLRGAPLSTLKKVVYRAHNIEADLWYKSFQSSRNPISKAFFWIQFKLIQKFEMDLVKKVRGVAAISQEDFDVLASWRANVFLVPLGLKFLDLQAPSAGESTNFVFVGRLDWPPNRDGLKWLLDQVWPEVIKKRKDAKLCIYGSGDRSWLNEYRRLENLEIIGFIPLIVDAYRNADFTIVPVFYGSGTRIKVIESFAMNRRLVSTRMGVQGAGLRDEDYIKADSKEDWIKTLSSLKPSENNQRLLEKSAIRLKAQFDEVAIAEKFYGWLKEL